MKDRKEEYYAIRRGLLDILKELDRIDRENVDALNRAREMENREAEELKRRRVEGPYFYLQTDMKKWAVGCILSGAFQIDSEWNSLESARSQVAWLNGGNGFENKNRP